MLATALTFHVEVIDNATMRLIIDDCPEPGLSTALTGPIDNFLIMSRVIQLKATIGCVAGRA